MKKLSAFFVFMLLLFSFCSAQIQLIEEDNSMAAHTVVTNQDVQPKQVNLVVAAYDQSGRLHGFKNAIQTIQPGETKILQTASISYENQHSYRFKSFLWDSFMNTNPLWQVRDSNNSSYSPDFALVPFDINNSVGNWLLGSILSYNGERAHYSWSGDCKVDFAFPSYLHPGDYEVYLYRAVNSDPVEAGAEATVKVITHEGMKEKVVAFGNVSSGWHKIGDFYFDSQSNEKVTVSKKSSIIRPTAVIFKKLSTYEAAFSNFEKKVPFMSENATGIWLLGGISDYKGDRTYYSSGSCSVSFYAPNDLLPGYNDIYIYRAISEIADPGATVTVNAGGATHNLTVSFHEGQTGWYKLGTFYCTGQTGEKVTVKNNNGIIRPGGAMFIRKPPKITYTLSQNKGTAGYLSLDSALIQPDDNGNFMVTANVPDNMPFISDIKLSDIVQLKAQSPSGVLKITAGIFSTIIDLETIDLNAILAVSGKSPQETIVKIILQEDTSHKQTLNSLGGIGVTVLSSPKSIDFFVSKNFGYEKLNLNYCTKAELSSVLDPKDPQRYKTCIIKLSDTGYQLVPSSRLPVSYDKPQSLLFDLSDAKAYAVVDKNVVLAPFENSSQPITTSEFARILMASQGKTSTIYGAGNITFENAAVLIAQQLIEEDKYRNTLLSDAQAFAAFTDASNISSDKVQAVKKLIESHIIDGSGSTLLNPKQPITGAYACNLIYNLLSTSVWESPLKDDEWELVFHDEFNGTDLDWNVWVSDYSSPSHILSSRYPENVKVEDGKVKLVTKKEDRGQSGWTTGNIWTKYFETTHGYFECRYIYPKATSDQYNIAFWLYRPSRNPKYQEIDINEGRMPNLIQTGIWGSDEGSENRWNSYKNYRMPYPLSYEYHVYAFEWTEEEMIWYFDGKVIRREIIDYDRYPMKVYLSTAIMKSANLDILDLDADQTSMDSDYVRVYKRKV